MGLPAQGTQSHCANVNMSSDYGVNFRNLVRLNLEFIETEVYF